MVVQSVSAVFRLTFCRFTVLALRSFYCVSRFPSCRFSQHTVFSKICFSVSRAALSGKLFKKLRAARAGPSPGKGGRPKRQGPIVGAEDRTPEIDASESIVDFLWHFPMDFQWHLPTNCHASVVCSKVLPPFQWIFTGIVQWTFSGIFQ